MGRTNPSETNPAQSRLRALNALGDALLIVSAQGRVVDWSGAASGLLGYDAREVVGRAVDLVLPRADLARLFPMASAHERLEASTSAHHRDGRDLPVLVTSTPLDNTEGRHVGWVCLLKDMGPWLRPHDGEAPTASAEPALLAAFHEITTPLGSSLDLDRTLMAMVKAVPRLIDADIACVSLLDDDRRTLRLRKSYGLRQPGAEARGWGRQESAWQALRTGKPQRLVDAWRLPREELSASSVIMEEPLRSCLMVPMRAAGRTLGVLAAYRRTVRPFDDRAAFLLGLLADHASLALDNALAYGELSRTRTRLESLLASTDAIWQPLPSADMTRVIARQAGLLVPNVDVLVWVPVSERPERMRAAGGSGAWAQAEVGREMPIKRTSLELPMTERRALECEIAPPADPLRQALIRASIGSLRLVPLVVARPGVRGAKEALGVLGFYRAGHGGYTSWERQQIEEFSKRVSLALHRVQLLEEANRTAERLRMAVEAAIDLSASLRPAEVMARVLRRAASAVAADAALLHVLDHDRVVIEAVHDLAPGPSVVGLRYPVRTQPLVRAALARGQPVAGGRLSMQSFPSELRPRFTNLLHTLVVPMCVEEQPIGLLILGRRGGEAFARAEMETMEMISSHAAAAVRNARLFSQAEEAGEAKSLFLNMAAHELRTPLSVVSGYLSMLSDTTFGDSPPGWREPLEILTAKTGELGRLIDDLLMASRLEGGEFPMSIQPMDLAQALRQAVGRAEPRANMLGGRIGIRTPRGPVPAEADPEYVARILDNLLNNALSYTAAAPAAVPRVRVTLSVRQGRARVAVLDGGRGVPEAERERIFERFIRVEDPDLSSVPGTGLGLYISRDLATRLGGDIRLEWSELGRGSRFVLTLPLAAVSGARS